MQSQENIFYIESEQAFLIRGEIIKEKNLSPEKAQELKQIARKYEFLIDKVDINLSEKTLMFS
jgi:hypothetical protein